MEEVTKDSWDHSSSFKASVTKLPNFRLKKPYRLDATMICRLFGEKYPQHIKFEWIHMFYHVVEKG